MEENRLRYLYQKFNDRTATDAEVEEFYLSLSDPAFEHVVKSILDDTWDTMSPLYSYAVAQDKAEKIYEEITAEKLPVVKELRLWPRIAVAAAVATIIFGAGLFFYKYHHKTDPAIVAYANDIAPGKVGATLTLASGRKIRLGDAANGEIAKEAGIVVSKTADGQIVYEMKEGSAAEDNKINTLTTAKGETYILILPDKSKVWMNAASSLTYSASLRERGLRRVKLEGEAYFQIAKDKAHPFIVESKGQEVEVLGTHFNISAYENEQIKTTLIEGSVKVTANQISKTLKPNQQALLTGTDAIQISDVEAEYAVEWVNGFFLFNGERLESIMNKVARWYNVEIKYVDPALKSRAFIGTISRFEKVSKVLNMLERTEVASFKIEGNKIIIDKKK